MPLDTLGPEGAGLLPTKLFIPVLEPGVVERGRVLDLLDSSEGARLLLVSAPAGSGKTTLVANWIRRTGAPACWVSLDPGDDDPHAFLGYLVEALGSLGPDGCERTRALLASGSPPPQAAVMSLVGDLVRSGVGGALVLDDLHVVSDPAVHGVLALLVERAPPAVRFVVITRSDPPLPLARMRARGQLQEIRESDLRFDPTEAAELLGRLCRRALRPESVAALARRTEGWAVGLQLAGLALRKAEDPEAFIAEFGGTHAYVADYLADEVLAGIPEEQQRFLIRTAPLRRLTGPLCDAALERSGSQALLDELSRANLFLVPLDGERRWYRYHHLFADLLLRRTGQDAEADREGILTRAAQWCEAHGDADAAIEYAVQAGDGTLAADLVARHGIHALAAGEGFTVLRWIRLLPDDVVQVSPDHCVIAAWALTLMHVHEPAGGLEDVEVERRGSALMPSPIHDPIGAYARRALAMLAAGRRAFPFVDDVEQHARVLLATADDEAGPEAALRALEEARDGTPEGNLALRAVAEIRVGELCGLLGRYDRGLAAQDRAREIAVRAGSELLRISALTGSALILLLQGRLEPLIAAVETELAGRRSLRESLGAYVGNLHATLAAALLERGDLEGAGGRLARAWGAWGASGDPADAWRSVASFGRPRPRASHLTVHGVLWGFATHIRLLIRRGDPDAALRQLDEVERSMSTSASATHRVVVDSLRVRAWTATGERTRLRQRWRDDPPAPSGVAYWDHIARVTRARAALGAGEPRAARETLAPLLDGSPEVDRDLAYAEALILDAIAASAMGTGHEPVAAGRTAEALEVTGSEGRTAPWVDAGPAVIPLLEMVIGGGGGGGDALAHALALLKGMRTGPVMGSEPGAIPLSERELAVLRLLAAGHTNEEIARALFLAVGTVKKHTHNIFGKLGVSNRTQAAQLAGERGLLGRPGPSTAS